MFFRNLTLFRFPVSLRDSLNEVEDVLAQNALKPIGPQELSARGFVSPFGRGETAMTHRVGDFLLFTLGGEDKLLPSSVVNEMLSDKLDQIRETEARSPSGRERKRIKDEVITDLLPRAFSRPSRVSAYLDLSSGWMLIDSSSRKVAEGVVSALREALGSFPAIPANPETSPRALMTAWISGEGETAALPTGFELGDECELRDPVDAGAIVRCRRQELTADEVREHLKVGKQAFQLALTFDDRLSFVLGEDMVVRKLRFLDAVTENLENNEADSRKAELDAVFALMSAELRVLLGRVEEIFQLSAAEA